MQLDMSTVEPSISGPKRPQDRINLKEVQKDFKMTLINKVGHKGFGLKPENVKTVGKFKFDGKEYEITHGSVVISAITSCTNTSNPNVMLAAGLLAKKAVEKGLSVKPYIKTSLSPGSGVVTEYFLKSGVQEYLDKLGFTTAGYGCMTCIGNSGDLPKEITDVIVEKDIVATAVLSGNRNFEGRIHPNTRANFLASPPLCVAYALAGRVDIDFEKEPIGTDKSGKSVYLKDIWPSNEEVHDIVAKCVTSEQFKANYADILKGSKAW